MTLPPRLASIADVILRRPEQKLTLDMVAEAVGDAAVSVEDIDLLFRALEAQGRTVGEEDQRSASAELSVTLLAARTLRAQLGRAPTAQEIAQQAGISLGSVRSALLFAKILQR